MRRLILYTKIRCNKDLFNDGLCFKKGKIYETPSVSVRHQLIHTKVVNEKGEPHLIGMWYGNFTLINE